MSELFPDASRGLQPLYAQIAEALRSRILDGSYQPHDRIPSESEMMLAFNVSRITVRQALKELENEGLIFKLQGKGSFVSRPRPFQELTRLQGFGQAMSQLGYETVNQVLGVATVAASPLVAERLALLPGTPVTEIRRVRHVDREPISLDVTYLSQDLGERLAREDLVGRDIFVIIENDYGLPLGHADLSIEATVADSDVAAALGIGRASPILRIERLVHGQDGRPLDFEFLYHRGDAFRYRLRVER